MDWQRIAIYVVQWALYLLAYGLLFLLLGKLPRRWSGKGCLVAVLVPIGGVVVALIVLHNWVYVFMSLTAYVIWLIMITIEADNRSWGHGL